jgi:hypothetical protein
MGSESRHPLPSPLWTRQTTPQEVTAICSVKLLAFSRCWFRILVLKTTALGIFLCFSWAHPLTCRDITLKWATNQLLTYRFVIIIYDHTRIRFYTTSVIDRGWLNNSGVDSFIHQWMYSLFLGCCCFFFSFVILYTQSVGLLWRGSARCKATDIHASRGIRIHDPSVRADEDSSCPRPRGHCDRPQEWIKTKEIVGLHGSILQEGARKVKLCLMN